MAKQVYVVTRHENVVKWVINEQLIDPMVTHMITHIDDAFTNALNIGDVVIGIIPIHLAAKICIRTCAPVFILSLPNIKPELRGKELTLAQMREAGARLDGFFVGQAEDSLMEFLS